MLVIFDGIDGSGKTTMVKKAVAHLRKTLTQDKVVESKDPGGTPLGHAIRRIMYQEVPTTEMVPGVVDLLFLASHMQNWETVVKPALLDGKAVVSDRWWPSAMAYMTERYVPRSIVAAYRNCRGGPANLFIFLHGDVKVMVDRARARTSETHQSSKAWNDYDVLSRIQEQYVLQFSTSPGWRPVCIDGKNQDQVWSEVSRILDFEVLGREHA